MQLAREGFRITNHIDCKRLAGFVSLNRVSDNVGRVKQIWGVLLRALEEERHFALVEEVPFQPRLAS